MRKDLECSIQKTLYSTSNGKNALKEQLKVSQNSRPCGLPAITTERESFNIGCFLKEFSLIGKMAKLEPSKLICYFL